MEIKTIYVVSNGNNDLGFISVGQFQELEKKNKIQYYPKNDKSNPMVFDDEKGYYLSLCKREKINI